MLLSSHDIPVNSTIGDAFLRRLSAGRVRAVNVELAKGWNLEPKAEQDAIGAALRRMYPRPGTLRRSSSGCSTSWKRIAGPGQRTTLNRTPPGRG